MPKRLPKAALAAARKAGSIAQNNYVKGVPKPPPQVGKLQPSSPGPSPLPFPSQKEIAALKEESTKKWRRVIWTLAFAAVTFTGTIYGAGLKTQQEWKAEKQKVQEATIDDRVAFIEQHKADLMRQKRELESKLGEIRARMAANAETATSAGDGGKR